MNKTTTDAKNILRGLTDVIDYVEELGHDSADEYGWESDLWDLFVLRRRENGSYIFEIYHWEDWYKSNGIHKYELAMSLPFEEACEKYKENYSRIIFRFNSLV